MRYLHDTERFFIRKCRLYPDRLRTERLTETVEFLERWAGATARGATRTTDWLGARYLLLHIIYYHYLFIIIIYYYYYLLSHITAEFSSYQMREMKLHVSPVT
jgi:hypothetical protein